MTDVLRARSLSDLISLVPAMFGFHPRDSLVAICLDHPSGRAGFRLRIDLPPPALAALAAEQLVGYLMSQDPHAVAIVAYAEAAQDADAQALVVEMVRRLREQGVVVPDAVRFDGDRYFSYTCEDSACCPPEGVACDVEGSPMLAEAVLQGVEILPDREALARRFAPVTGRARRAAEQAVAAAAAERAAAAAEVGRAAEAERAEAEGDRARARVAEAGRAKARAEEEWGPEEWDPEEWGPEECASVPSGDEAALVRAGLARVLPIVDAVLAGPPPAGASVGDAVPLSDLASLAVWSSTTVIRDVLLARITPQAAGAFLALWRDVSVVAVAPYEAAPLTLAAFAAWLSGDGAQAQCALDRVTEVAPAEPLARTLQVALAAGVDPRAWRGLSADDVLRRVPGF